MPLRIHLPMKKENLLEKKMMDLAEPEEIMEVVVSMTIVVILAALVGRDVIEEELVECTRAKEVMITAVNTPVAMAPADDTEFKEASDVWNS